MHVVHHTDAFILKVQPLGEANVRVWLFTRTFGLVIAVAQGVRKQGAKLQMQLSDYAFIAADLVRGKDLWRLTSATALHTPLLEKHASGFGRSYVRTLSALERFCHGEEANEPLFAHLEASCAALEAPAVDERSLDTISLWKVMALLGYLSIEREEESLFSLPLPEAAQALSSEKRSRLIQKINHVIKETHL